MSKVTNITNENTLLPIIEALCELGDPSQQGNMDLSVNRFEEMGQDCWKVTQENGEDFYCYINNSSEGGLNTGAVMFTNTAGEQFSSAVYVQGVGMVFIDQVVQDLKDKSVEFVQDFYGYNIEGELVNLGEIHTSSKANQTDENQHEYTPEIALLNSRIHYIKSMHDSLKSRELNAGLDIPTPSEVNAHWNDCPNINEIRAEAFRLIPNLYFGLKGQDINKA
jgi:hypothetical protein